MKDHLIFVVCFIEIGGAAIKRKWKKTNCQLQMNQESECTMVRFDLSRCSLERNTDELNSWLNLPRSINWLKMGYFDIHSVRENSKCDFIVDLVRQLVTQLCDTILTNFVPSQEDALIHVH